MLLREDVDGVICIGQASHAWLAGQLAAAWGNDAFPAPTPREEVCLGATQHDIGMAEWDLAPTLNPHTGRPHSFLEMPLETHIALWSAAPRRVMSQSRYAALLVSMHGTALYGRRDLASMEPDGAALVRGYLDTQRALQRTLVAQLGAGAEEVRRNQRLIWTWDSLSLAVCLPWPEYTLSDVPGRSGGIEVALRMTERDRFTLTPWPFADPVVEVRCEGRRLEGRFERAEALHEALAEAPALSLRFMLAAA